MAKSGVDVAHEVGLRTCEPGEQPFTEVRTWFMGLVTELDKRGNTQEELFKLTRAALADIEATSMQFAASNPAAAARVTMSICAVTAILSVLEATPLYGSRALSLQLESAIDALLKQSAGVVLEKPPEVSGVGRAELRGEMTLDNQLPDGHAPTPDDADARTQHYTRWILANLEDEHPSVRASVACSVLLSTVRSIDKLGTEVDAEAMLAGLLRAVRASRAAVGAEAGAAH